jgi:hypothetical protein
MAERVVLCRPQGGLNDMLCQIERCCRYAERYARTVVVETDYAHAAQFRAPFSNYFVSQQPRLVFGREALRGVIDAVDVAPQVVAGRLDTYRTRYDRKIFAHVEEESGAPVTFDFALDHPQATLLHHAAGGGQIAAGFLSRVRLHDTLTDLLIRRARVLGPRYTGLHIRNTDYKTRYEPRVDNLAKDIAGPVFVATDNRNCLAYCQHVFGRERVYSFAKLPAVAGRPLHVANESVDAHEANRDAILDLLLLALSERCFALELETNAYGVRFSGFSMLAMQLQSARPLIGGLLSRADHTLNALLWPGA